MSHLQVFQPFNTKTFFFPALIEAINLSVIVCFDRRTKRQAFELKSGDKF